MAFLVFAALAILRPLSGAAADERLLRVRVGFSADIFYDVAAKDARAALEVWTRQIASGTGRPFEAKAVVLEDAEDLVAATARDELDVVVFPSMEYIRLRDRIPIDPVFVGSRGGSPYDEHILVVRRESEADGLAALRGKRLTTQSGALGAMALTWLDTVLLRRRLPESEHFFGQIRGVGKPSQAMLPVFFRQAEAAVVTRASYATMLELNPQLGRQLVTLAESPKLLLTIVGFRRGLDGESRRLIADSALRLDASVSGRQVLMLFKVTAIRPFDPSYLDGVSALIRAHRALREGG